MTHRNAFLTPRGRLALAKCVVEDGWTLRRAAERFNCSPATAKKWADRYREGGPAAMGDVSSRPHHCPHQLPVRRERRIIKVRFTKRWGAPRIAAHLKIARSTVEAVMRRYRMPLLRHLDQNTGLPVRRPKPHRYEHPAPGIWCMSTSRNWAASPTVAGTASSAAPSVTTTTRNRAVAMPTCTTHVLRHPRDRRQTRPDR
jgi:transposase-like protein